MKPPRWNDPIVRVRAYLTDEVFGHDHWRAAQFCVPEGETRPALLLTFVSDDERAAVEPAIKRLLKDQP